MTTNTPVSEIPKFIWLQLYGDSSPEDGPIPDVTQTEITWCWEPIFEHDVKYILHDKYQQLELALATATALLDKRTGELAEAESQIVLKAQLGFPDIDIKGVCLRNADLLARAEKAEIALKYAESTNQQAVYRILDLEALLTFVGARKTKEKNNAPLDTNGCDHTQHPHETVNNNLVCKACNKIIAIGMMHLP